MNLINLIKIYMLNSLGINKAINEKDAKKKRKANIITALIIGAIICAFVISFGYSYMVSQSVENQELIVGLMMGASSIIIFATFIFLVRGTIIGMSDYQSQISLPISTKEIVASRFGILYIYSLILTLILILPAQVLYCIKVSPSIGFYILSFILFFMIPIIPLVISVSIGIIIQLILARFKNGNLVGIIVNVLLILILTVVGVNFSDISENVIENFTSLIEIGVGIYPLAPLYIISVCNYEIGSALIFALESILVLAVFIYIVSIKFKEINNVFFTSRSNGNYKVENLNQLSIQRSLFIKEFKKFSSCNVYVMNTTFGIIGMIALSVAVLCMGENKIISLIGNEEIFNIVKSVVPCILAALVAFTTITASAISMEGKSFWIIKTLPINPKEIFKSMILVNLLVTLPVALISSVILIIGMDFNRSMSILIVLTPAVYCFFTSIFGLFINLLFPVLDWTSEVVVVKQSISAIIAVLVGEALAIIPAVLILFVKSVSATLILSVATILILAISLVLYILLQSKGVEIFNKLR